jgi:hypothetical protein
MNKVQYIVLAAIVALIVLVVMGSMYIFGAHSTPSLPVDTAQNSFPDSRPAVTPGEQTAPSTARKDILQDPETKADTNNKGHYFVGNSVDPTSSAPPNVPYVIEYIAATDFFSIALMQEPIGAARTQAEQYLMKHLGIAESEMCHLRYTVTTPAWVDTTYANTSLGFSFCAGATPLP